MKHFTLLLLICSFLVQPNLHGQTNINTIIQSNKGSYSDLSDVIKIRNVEHINSDGIEYSPVFHKSGVVFSTDQPRKQSWFGRMFSNKNSNLFFTGLDEDGNIWDAIPLPGKINTNRHEGSATFSADNNLMIYTRNSKKPSVNGYYELKLTSARFVEGQWLEEKDLPFNGNYRNCHPALSSDGKLLVFASNRPNGLGGLDLYASTFENGEWTTPYNLGQEINTSGDDVFPFIDVEGNLYFSSNGHPGVGGLDLYKASQEESCGWSNVYRFPEPFNSLWDDFSFVADQSLANGFFSSNRPGGYGQDDIYGWKLTESIELPEEIAPEQLLTQFSIIDEKTGLPLNEANVTLIKINPNLLKTGFLEEPITIVNQLDDNVLSLLGTVVKPTDNPEPIISYPIIAKESYMIIARRDGQAPHQQIVSADQLSSQESYSVLWENEVTEDIAISEEVEIPSPLLPIVLEKETKEVVVGGIALIDEIEESITSETESESIIEVQATEEIFTSRSIPSNLLKKTAPISLESAYMPADKTVLAFSPIYHDFNESKVLSHEQELIDNIVWELQKNKSYFLTIKSHTDSRGSEAYNLELSQKRAENVKQQLITKGISSDRLEAVGMGEILLLNDCGNDNPCSEEDHKKNRRTEFLIKRK